jgi:Sec-independent protein secretion pathway component TatC
VAFFYFLVLPISLRFFVTFSENTALTPPTPTAIEESFLKDPKRPHKIENIPEGNDPSLVFPRIPLVKSDPPPPEDESGILVMNVREGRFKLITKYRTTAMMVTQEGSMFAEFPRLSEYLSFVMVTSLVFGLAFELPMVIMILAQVDIVRTQTFRDIRKYAYFGLAVTSAVVAPTTDLLMMMFLLVPMILLYELGIIAAAFMTRGREQEESQD